MAEHRQALRGSAQTLPVLHHRQGSQGYCPLRLFADSERYAHPITEPGGDGPGPNEPFQSVVANGGGEARNFSPVGVSEECATVLFQIPGPTPIVITPRPY